MQITRKLAALAFSALALSPVAIGAGLVTATPALARNDHANHGNAGNSGDRGNGGNAGSRGAERSASARSGGPDKAASGDHGSRGKGAIASELKGLNAMHASPTAMANAAPGSQVGRIATYKEAAETTKSEYSEWQEAYTAYMDFKGSYDGPGVAELNEQIDAATTVNSRIEEEIAALDPTAPDYDSNLAALEAQKVDIDALEAQLETAEDYETELARLKDASNAQGEEYQQAKTEEEEALEGATGGRTLSEAALDVFRTTLGL